MTYADKEQKVPPSFQRRFVIFAIVLSAAALAVLIRYAAIMLNPRGVNPPLSQNLPLERGPILDRNGRILAMQTRLGNITLWRPEAGDPALLAAELSPLLDIPEETLRGLIEEPDADFIYLKRKAEQSTIKAVEAAKAEGKLRGVGIEPIMGRVYPEQRLASQIVGFVGNENKGLAGIEYAFEDELAPEDKPAGSQVILTIDANVQYILEELGRRVKEETNAEAVMFLAMDPRSGEILGSASVPDFNPNDFQNSNETERMNRPAIWAYEPGSVFKVFSLAALLDAGAITRDTVFTCNGHYEKVLPSGQTINIGCLSAHGRVSAREIIIYSCNAGAAYAADKLDADSFYYGLKNFGFGERTGLGIPGETAGFLRPVEHWSDRSKPTIAMGQELAVSALQMLHAATAVANNGVLVKPKIVSRIVSPDGRTVTPYESPGALRVLKSETAGAIRGYMVDVASSIGTGSRANVEDLSLAVKTGTAQLIDPQTGGYSSTDFIASCLAILPAESPSLVLYLVIVKPQGEILGGRIAAPAIREAAEELINYLGIPRGRNPQITHSGTVSVPEDGFIRIGDVMPDLVGLSKRQLIPLMLRDDIVFEMNGDGWVRRQTPGPGAPIQAGTKIILELE